MEITTMGTRADFYINDDKSMEWVGSIYKDGSPINIPVEILIQTNPVMFEELTVEFLESRDSVIKKDGDAWPWPWADSRMTDYSYIFTMDRVLAYSMAAKHLFTPLKIVQGEDLNSASYLPLHVSFPIMLKQAVKSTEELLNQYGYQPTQAI